MAEPSGQTSWPAPVETRATRLFGIRYPIIQAGMVWTAGRKLAVAVSEAGGLGLIGAGSMRPEMLKEHIRKAREATDHPFGVNIPLSRGDAEELVRSTIDGGVRIVFTSAGHPMKFTNMLKAAGCTVVHVIAAVKHARKALDEGCDAVVAEGFEAGGHNGVDEIATLALVPQIVDAVSIPVIAAGGIADGRGVAAALALGAEAVQVGTRFAVSLESSASDRFKKAVVEAGDAGTVLTLRRLVPTRMLRTAFAQRAVAAEREGASKEAIATLFGTRRERMGIFEGDTEEGAMEAGQGSGLISDIPPAADIVRRLMEGYHAAKRSLP